MGSRNLLVLFVLSDQEFKLLVKLNLSSASFCEGKLMNVNSCNF